MENISHPNWWNCLEQNKHPSYSTQRQSGIGWCLCEVSHLQGKFGCVPLVIWVALYLQDVYSPSLKRRYGTEIACASVNLSLRCARFQLLTFLESSLLLYISLLGLNIRVPEPSLNVWYSPSHIIRVPEPSLNVWYSPSHIIRVPEPSLNVLYSPSHIIRVPEPSLNVIREWYSPSHIIWMGKPLSEVVVVAPKMPRCSVRINPKC